MTQGMTPSGFGAEPHTRPEHHDLPPAEFGNASGPRAGFWRRWAASVVDVVVVVIGFLILYAALKGVGVILGLIGYLAYYIVLTGGPSGQTLGKKALGIRVTGLSDGGPIGYGRSTVRFLVAAFISNLLVGIPLGYVWMLWDDEKQTWHDKAADSVVVPAAG